MAGAWKRKKRKKPKCVALTRRESNVALSITNSLLKPIREQIFRSQGAVYKIVFKGGKAIGLLKLNNEWARRGRKAAESAGRQKVAQLFNAELTKVDPGLVRG